jgi:hypothetical protein
MILGLENIAVVAMLHLPVTNRQAPENAIVASAAQIPSRWKPFQRCIVSRESHGHIHSRNPRSSAQGKYQFLDHLWRASLGRQVAARLRHFGMSKAQADTVRARLQRIPIADWPESYQDAAFAAVISQGNWRPWYQAGSPCNGYAR